MVKKGNVMLYIVYANKKLSPGTLEVVAKFRIC